VMTRLKRRPDGGRRALRRGSVRGRGTATVSLVRTLRSEIEARLGDGAVGRIAVEAVEVVQLEEGVALKVVDAGEAAAAIRRTQACGIAMIWVDLTR